MGNYDPELVALVQQSKRARDVLQELVEEGDDRPELVELVAELDAALGPYEG